MTDTRRGQSRPKLAWDEQGDCDEVLNKIEGLQQKFPVFDELVRNFNEQYIAAKEEVINLKLEYENKTEYSKSQAVAKLEYEKKLTEANEEIELLRSKQARLEEDIKKKDSKEKKLAAEIGTLRTRLSQVMGSKLTDNPAIADLSDKYRPSKLGEKYSELYDNEWTDAYEEINKTCDEKETIQKLLHILMYVYKKCQGYWKEYTTNLERALTVNSRMKLPEYVMTQYKNFSKNVAPELIDYFYEIIANGAYEYPIGSIIRDRRCESYVKGCVACCWLMAAQDPPVTIDTEDRISKIDFDTNLFRPYTQTGDKLDYVVWPPLYLHHEGPLLCKGVAQAVKRERTKGAQVSSTGSNGRSSVSKVNLASTLPLSDKRNKNMDVQYQTGSRGSPVNMDITDTSGQDPFVDTSLPQSFDRNQETEITLGQKSKSDTQQTGYDQIVIWQSQNQGFSHYGTSSLRGNVGSNEIKSLFGSDLHPNEKQDNGKPKLLLTDTGKSKNSSTSPDTLSLSTQSASWQTNDQHNTMGDNQLQRQGRLNFTSSNTQIPWSHSRFPSDWEMGCFTYYINVGKSEYETRRLLGDEVFNLCRDYNIYLTKFYSQSTN